MINVSIDEVMANLNDAPALARADFVKAFVNHLGVVPIHHRIHFCIQQADLFLDL